MLELERKKRNSKEILKLYDPTDVGNLISGSSTFSKIYLNFIWKFLVHILLEPSLENCENYFASM